MIPLIITLIIVVAVIQIRFLESALKSVKYDCHFSKHLVEPGEEFEITVTITNRSRAFIPFIKIEQVFPGEIRLKGLKISETAAPKEYMHHTSTLYLMPRSKYIKRVKASFPHRGRYIFPGAYIRVGDFLALGDKVKEHESKQQEVVVYPKAAHAEDLENVTGGIMGDISVRRFVMEDPVMIAGFREYSGREPMKAISWSHSARMGKLVVKQFDHTVEPAVSVILDVEDKGFMGRVSSLRSEIDAKAPPATAARGDADKKEFAFSYTGSLCRILEARGMKYDFLTNATTANTSNRWSYIPEGIGARHFSVIMEGLGRASHTHVEPLKTIIDNYLQKKNYDRFVILITIKSKSRILADAGYIEKNNGGKVYVISIEEYLAYETGIFSETAV